MKSHLFLKVIALLVIAQGIYLLYLLSTYGGFDCFSGVCPRKELIRLMLEGGFALVSILGPIIYLVWLASQKFNTLRKTITHTLWCTFGLGMAYMGWIAERCFDGSCIRDVEDTIGIFLGLAIASASLFSYLRICLHSGLGWPSITFTKNQVRVLVTIISIIAVVVTMLHVGATYRAKVLSEKHNIDRGLSLQRQCLYREYGLTTDSETAPLYNRSFISFGIDQGVVSGQEYFFRAESDSYHFEFEGVVEKKEDAITGQVRGSVTFSDPGGEIPHQRVEDFSFMQGQAYKDPFQHERHERMDCNQFDELLASLPGPHRNEYDDYEGLWSLSQLNTDLLFPGDIGLDVELTKDWWGQPYGSFCLISISRSDCPFYSSGNPDMEGAWDSSYINIRFSESTSGGFLAKVTSSRDNTVAALVELSLKNDQLHWNFIEYLQSGSSDRIPYHVVLDRLSPLSENNNEHNTCEIDLTEETTEGGKIVGSFNNDELNKIEVTYYGETGRREQIVSIVNNEIKSVLDRNISYTAPIYVEGSEILEMNELEYSQDDLVRLNNLDLLQSYLSKLLDQCPNV